MKELQTILGTDIPIITRGIVYLGKFNYEDLTLTIIGERFYRTQSDALHAYADTPNPESQMVSGGTFNILITNLFELHKQMKTKEWLENLAASI